MTIYKELENKFDNRINNTNKETLKKYLIAIESDNGAKERITINGDSLCPFSISRNLWSYKVPWMAARRLKTLAESWEKNGHKVSRIYGTVLDMPTRGNKFNIKYTIYDFI